MKAEVISPFPFLERADVVAFSSIKQPLISMFCNNNAKLYALFDELFRYRWDKFFEMFRTISIGYYDSKFFVSVDTVVSVVRPVA